MTILPGLRSRASATRRTIVLGEGTDPRIVEGAVAAVTQSVANVILVGPEADVSTAIAAAGGGELDGITIADPTSSPLTPALAEALQKARAHKGMTIETALNQVQDPLVFSALLVREGYADGTLNGAVATTPDVVRAALQVIGKAPDAAIVSSFFLMVMPDGHPGDQDAVLFSDCGLVVDPSASELAAIAIASAASHDALLGSPARIAMLSFSTLGSARHPNVDKVVEATALVRQECPELTIDGELQFDTAFVPSVGASKAPAATLQGDANVFIFPNLDAGNIGYKVAQRIGGAAALGPVLQGLAAPANDLSRGCTADDVLNMIAVTALQVRD